MAANIFLVRNGETSWRAKRLLLGRRDLGIAAQGQAQAQAAANTLVDVEVTELLSSPLARAMETADCFAKHHGIDVARDQRLTDLDVGPWEGRKLDEIWETDEFQQFIHSEVDSFPGGERLESVRTRVVASIEQALVDNPGDANIVIVSHSAPLRIAIAHYLGMPIGNFHRLRLSHGSVSVLRFEADLQRTRVLAINWSAPISALLEESR